MTAAVQRLQELGHSDQVSETIRISRLICIFGVVYVHAWTGLDGGALGAASGTPQGMLRWGLVELFGRSAVPLLGMIAGWLSVGSIARRPYGRFLAEKARTVLAPMVLWNALAMILVCGAAARGWILAPQPTTWWWTIDELFCLASPNDINVQTPFLRDLFVCMAMAPLLSRTPSWGLAAGAAAVLAWSVSGLSCPLLLRPAILFFFILGVAVRRMDWAPKAGIVPLWAAALPYGSLAALRVWLEASGQAAALPGPLGAGLDLLLRLAAAAFVWFAAWRLARTSLAPSLARLEPYAFLMFCDHLIFMWLAGPLIGRVTGPLGAPLYPLFLLLQPLLVLLATVALGRGLARFAPRTGRLLSGGRVGSGQRRRAGDRDGDDRRLSQEVLGAN